MHFLGQMHIVRNDLGEWLVVAHGSNIVPRSMASASFCIAWVRNLN